MAGPTRGKGNVLGHGQGGDRGKVLVDHAQAEIPCLSGRPDRPILTIESDRSRIGQHHAVSDVHQGGFACAILTQQGVHFTGGQSKIGSAKCLHGAESLSNPQELEKGRHWSETSRMIVELPVEIE
jgi:hypothetical protein